ncbi:MAG: prepilin-type N-terminal cleavage/methylation domain-containing protein [Verrucomicrobiota bacterium]|nr:prepilin-type N-terminal cleavage/methylation domain-containing protein [Verrucomicrobiota bacterium]MEC8649474.1 prepilin-type N-terminal cleavage/methylation domain-containing protein [Verrucomicrobiota bacterium]
MRPYKKIITLNPAGFTLVELIGVLVIIAILSAAVLPSAIDIIRVQRAVDEAAELPKVAEALKRGMLREQIFPLFENNSSVATSAEDNYWWNLASRHGGGSANELRYPVGIRPSPATTTTRMLYFAENTWAGDSFFQITGDGSGWLSDEQNPTELRLLLVSTTNPDLPLPNTLNVNSFNNFWENWAVGDDGDPVGYDGDPATGNWGDWENYGLNQSKWKGRAAELNVQRIDLRDLLCTVVIENRLAIQEAGGANLSAGFTNALGFWDRGSVSVTSKNLQNAKFILQSRESTEDENRNNTLDAGEDVDNNGYLDRSEDLNGNGTLDQFLDETTNNYDYNGNGIIDPTPYSEDVDLDGFFDHPAQIYSYVDAVIQVERGQRIDGNQPATVIVSGQRSFQVPINQSITVPLTLTDLAPLGLVNPYADPNNSNPQEPLLISLNGSATNDWSENRYFLRRQEILLGDPWNQAEVGIFTIIEPFSTLRFDGEKWIY